MTEVLGAEFRLFKAALKECYRDGNSENAQEDIKLMIEMMNQSLNNNEITNDRWQYLHHEMGKIAQGYGFKMKV